MGISVYKRYQISDKNVKIIEISVLTTVIALTVLAVVIALYDYANYGIFMLLAQLCNCAYIMFNSNGGFQKVIIDEDNDTLSMTNKEKYPIRISNIRDIKIRKRSLFIHDNGTYFMDIRLPKTMRLEIMEHLKRLNPNIEIKNE